MCHGMATGSSSSDRRIARESEQEIVTASDDDDNDGNSDRLPKEEKDGDRQGPPAHSISIGVSSAPAPIVPGVRRVDIRDICAQAARTALESSGQRLARTLHDSEYKWSNMYASSTENFLETLHVQQRTFADTVESQQRAFTEAMNNLVSSHHQQCTYYAEERARLMTDNNRLTVENIRLGGSSPLAQQAQGMATDVAHIARLKAELAEANRKQQSLLEETQQLKFAKQTGELHLAGYRTDSKLQMARFDSFRDAYAALARYTARATGKPVALALAGDDPHAIDILSREAERTPAPAPTTVIPGPDVQEISELPSAKRQRTDSSSSVPPSPAPVTPTPRSKQGHSEEYTP